MARRTYAGDQRRNILKRAGDGQATLVAVRASVKAERHLPSGWQQVLRSVEGVFILVDVDSGQQYVGSANGADSLLGRWLDYAHSGDGGDKGLKAATVDGPRSY